MGKKKIILNMQVQGQINMIKCKLVTVAYLQKELTEKVSSDKSPFRFYF